MESLYVEEILEYLLGLGLIDKEVMNSVKDSTESIGGMFCVNHRRFESDKMVFKFYISQNPETNVYVLNEYSASLLKIPQIDHGIMTGIDTAELENRLNKFKWDLDSIPLSNDGNELSETFFDLIYLAKSKDEAISNIADLLMLKYWADTPMERIVNLTPARSKYENGVFFSIRNNLNDTDSLQAYNLLCGRAVLKFECVESNRYDAYWLVVENRKLITLPDFDISGHLKKLPFETPLNALTGPELLLEMMKGNRVEVDLIIDKMNVKTFIEADPRTGSIVGHDLNDQRVDLVNLINKKTERKTNQPIKNTPRKPRKGRSL